MAIYAFIQLLLNEGMKRGMIEPMDEIYVRNRLLALLQLDEFKDTENLENYRNQLPDDPEIVIPYIIDQIVQYACERGIIEDYFDIREIFSAKIMDCFLPHPSTVNRIFFRKVKTVSPRSYGLFLCDKQK